MLFQAFHTEQFGTDRFVNSSGSGNCVVRDALLGLQLHYRTQFTQLRSSRGNALHGSSYNGVCDGGRVKHQLRHNWPRPEYAIVFVGFRVAGTVVAATVQSPSVVMVADAA
ncbi:MAG: hypothetical protein WD929_10765 [Steroidobacteraceae bacterium]